MERYHLRQSDKLASNVNVQSEPTGLEFVPIQEQSIIQYVDNPEYLEAKFQVERWGNWVKFVSIYIMLKSLTSILGVGYNLMSSSKLDQQERDMITVTLLAFIISLIAGFIGFKAGTERSSMAAKYYIIMVIISVIADGIVLYSYIPLFIEGLCEFLEKDPNSHPAIKYYYCDYKSNISIYIIFGISYLIVSLLIFTPIIWCPCKLIKYSEIVSKGARKLPIHVPAEAIPFNP